MNSAPPRTIVSVPLLLPPSYMPKYFPQHPVLEHPQTMYCKGLLCINGVSDQFCHAKSSEMVQLHLSFCILNECQLL